MFNCHLFCTAGIYADLHSRHTAGCTTGTTAVRIKHRSQHFNINSYKFNVHSKISPTVLKCRPDNAFPIYLSVRIVIHNNNYNFTYNSIILIVTIIKCQTPTQTNYSTPAVRTLESERPMPSRVESTNQQLGVNVCLQSADVIQNQPSIKFGLTPSTRSANYKGNRVGHVPLKEAGSDKGEEFLETPILTTLRRNTPLTHRGWAMGRGRGGRLEGAKTSTQLRNWFACTSSKNVI